MPPLAGGKPGFALVPASETSINFINHLSEQEAADNRVLENGSGVALGDVDGDGWCDIYLCGLASPNKLYRNLGNWEFEDVTAQSGVACAEQYSTGAVLADVDGNGTLDLLVNSIGNGTRLFLNNGKASFVEEKNAGLLRRFGSMSMALADIDRDGDLDLYVTNYRTDTFKDSPPGLKVDVNLVNGKPVVRPEDRFLGVLTPDGGSVSVIEKGEPDALYLNDGKGRFSVVSWTDGRFRDEHGQPLKQPPHDWGLAAMFRDLNRDGAPDLYVCNDFFYWRDRVWMNDGQGQFQEIPPHAMRNMSMSSMSVDVADINRDGWDDLFVADMLSRTHTIRQRQRPDAHLETFTLPVDDPNYRPEISRNTLFLNRGDNTYAEIAQFSGIDASEWTWSSLFLDVDLDGFEDLLLTTGHGHHVLDGDALAAAGTGGNPSSAENRLANLRKFPPLHTPNFAFRNKGDLTFEEMGRDWGFDASGVSHGMAAGDLDNDGDLDLVVNNYNAVASVYRNLSSAPRIAVRLQGRAPNTAGVGSRISVRSSSLSQSQEIICGGRYVSGDAAMRVFATPGAGPFALEIVWASGARSYLGNVEPNYLYEFNEPADIEGVQRTPAAQADDAGTRLGPPWPLFTDASALLKHQHAEEPFNDFLVQSLLPHRLSELGPGIAWHDFDWDGYDELVVGGGRGGYLTLLANEKGKSFLKLPTPGLGRDETGIVAWNQGPDQPTILAGAANYEDGTVREAQVLKYDLATQGMRFATPAQHSSPGPIALADWDNDADLDLFVGGRVIPKRYPEPASSFFYRNSPAGFALDVANSQVLTNAGMVSGAVFADLDSDGFTDLLLAMDSGPIRWLRNQKGNFTDVTADFGLEGLKSRWNAIATGDFDNDGRMDIVASSWGRNTPYQKHLHHPITVYYGDFNGDESLEVVESYHALELSTEVPFAEFSLLSSSMPFLREAFPNYSAYSKAAVADVLATAAVPVESLELNTFDSVILLNRGDRFEPRALPAEAQFAPAFGLSIADFDGDGNEDIFLAQNFFGVAPQISRYDAGRGLLLAGNGTGSFEPVSGMLSGIKIYGEQRGSAAGDFNADGRMDLVVAQNNGETKLYQNQSGRPGLRVYLYGPPSNRSGVGAQLQITYESGRLSPLREIQAGSGYWSQDSAVSIFDLRESPAKLMVRWPGDYVVASELKAGMREIGVDLKGQVKELVR